MAITFASNAFGKGAAVLVEKVKLRMKRRRQAVIERRNRFNFC